MKKIVNSLICAGSYIILSILFLLSFLASYSTSIISVDTRGYTYFLRDSILGNLMFLTAVIIAFYLLKKMSFIKNVIQRINNNDKLFAKISTFFLSLLFIVSSIYVLYTHLQPVADSFWVLEAVDEFINGNYSAFAPGGYIDIYPNQIGLFWYEYLISILFGSHNYILFQIINVLALVISYKCLGNISKYMGLSNSEIILIYVLGFLFTPMIIYTAFVYGNLIGLATSLIGINMAFRYINGSSFSVGIVSCVFLALSAALKQNYLISIIAIVIVMLFAIDPKKSIKYVATLILFLSMFQIIPKNMVEVATGYKLNQGVSSLSYVAMGLQEGDRAPGWYNGYNMETYLSSSNNKQEATEISKVSIKERISKFNKNKGYAISFFLKKISSQWNEPTYESLAVAKNMQYYTFMRNTKIDQFLGSEFSQKLVNFLNPFQFIMYSLSFLYMVDYTCKKDNRNIATITLLIVFTGGFLFHLLWEAKGQYAVTYFILLFPFGIKGLSLVNNFDPTLYSRKKIVVISVLLIAFILILIILDGKWILNDLIKDGKEYYEYYKNAL